ncbi:MAG: response regulator [Gemmatimonadales bacterium]
MSSLDALPLALFRPPVVLVVEGRATSRLTTCRLLRALGYEGQGAHNGQQALRIMRQHPALFHLIIANALLPDMDGGELAERAKDQEPGIRVVLVADYVPLGRTAEILEAFPELPVLSKPFGFRELYAVLTPLLGPPRIAVALPAGRRLRRRSRERKVGK